MINRDLLDVLACPRCKRPVVLSEDGRSLLCDHDRLRYRIEDEIPVMLTDEADPY
jgi:uncharacterized protein YbaR (Trm112 family)